MKKARDQMIKDQDALENEDDESGDDDNGNGAPQNLQNSLVSSNEMDGILNSVADPYAIRRPAKVVTKPAKVIELAVFTDEELFKEWRTRFPQQTEANVKQYVLTLVNNVRQHAIRFHFSFDSMYTCMLYAILVSSLFLFADELFASAAHPGYKNIIPTCPCGDPKGNTFGYKTD